MTMTDSGFDEVLNIFKNPFKNKLQKRMEFDLYLKANLYPEVIDQATGVYERLLNNLEA